jgi:hypothetical protein
MHSLVVFCFVLDLACSVSNWISIYLLTVSHWGDLDFASTQNVAMYAGIFATGVVSFNVQSFLILRYYSLSRKRFVSVVLCAIALVASGAAFATASTIAMHSSYAERGHIALPGLSWLASTALVDWSIAAVLVCELHKMKVVSNVKSTTGIIMRLISNVISTGALPSTVATVSLINFVVNQQTNVATGLGLCLGRVYTLTMLYNINYVYGDGKFLRPNGSGTAESANVQLTTDLFGVLSTHSRSGYLPSRSTVTENSREILSHASRENSSYS